MNILLDRFPRLQKTLPYVALASLPTPVQRMERLERALDGTVGALYVKRDDLSGQVYGGNKARKLEFLLGKALQDGRRAVLTFGAAGSNHALATAIYARQLGLGCISMLVPQPNASYVRRNLLMGHRVGAEFHHHRNMLSVAGGALCQLLCHRLRDGRIPQIIPPGGSSPLGMIGFVNAGMELKVQIEAHAMPYPDVVYVASGTMGTAMGLLLGFKIAGIPAQLMAVRVTDPAFTSVRKAHRFFRQANALLHAADETFPELDFPKTSMVLRHDHYGAQYALYTEEGVAAVRRVEETEGVHLEGTYTGKTFAALLADAEAGLLKDKTVLFWNTYDSHDFNADVAGMDYHALPKAFHRYFEEDVQPLDRATRDA
jgi:1-aminocyclopropane-1-carboxylate deaminase/D-cysteine desulfhydrase-like pyridoxal-dependent ACC family enzyme